jgi:hypothetical protein
MTRRMTKRRQRATLLTVGACAVLLSFCPIEAQQTASSSSAATTWPRLVRFNGTAKDLNGNSLSGVIGITFALYAEQSGGAALWLETQNVQPAGNGRYTALLGATKPEGLPADLFTSEQARWVGVQISGQAEQPRILLLSVPYAFQAGDAATIGGLPPSAFVLASPATGSPGSSESAGLSGDAVPAGGVTGTGAAGFIPLWTAASNIGNSVLFQSGSGASAKVGINTSTPGAALEVKGTANIAGLLALPATGAATSGGGKVSQGEELVASSFDSGTAAPVNQSFVLRAEPAANNTASPSATLNLLFGSGTTAPAETGWKIASNGQMTFAKGQIFPGAGTITGVTAGTDLTGGGSSGKITLNLDTTKVPQLATANTFTASQTVNGTVTAVSAGNGIVGITTSASFGVTGQSSNSGVFGASFGTSTLGAGRGNAGVWGDTGAGADSGHAGVLGTADANTAGWFMNNGPFATVLAENFSPDVAGAFGVAALSNNVGVYGIESSTSALGASDPFPAGLWGDTGITDGIAVYGTADSGRAGLFANNNSDSGASPTLEVANLGSNPEAPVFAAGGVGGECSLDAGGDLSCTGAVTADVPVHGGSRRVALYAIEGPENWFEDIGSGKLSNGSARVELDPAFAETANTEMDFKVFPVPNGDCKGLYVANKTPTSFEVRELGGGTSNVAFDYRIIAKRRGYESLRLADKTKQFSNQEAELKRMRLPLKLPAAPTVSPVPVTRFQAAARPTAAPAK